MTRCSTFTEQMRQRTVERRRLRRAEINRILFLGRLLSRDILGITFPLGKYFTSTERETIRFVPGHRSIYQLRLVDGDILHCDVNKRQ